MRSRLQRKAVCCALTKQHCGRTALNTCIHAMHTRDAKCAQPDGRRGKASRLTGRRKHAVDQLLLSALRARQLRLLHSSEEDTGVPRLYVCSQHLQANYAAKQQGLCGLWKPCVAPGGGLKPKMSVGPLALPRQAASCLSASASWAVRSRTACTGSGTVGCVSANVFCWLHAERCCYASVSWSGHTWSGHTRLCHRSATAPHP